MSIQHLGAHQRDFPVVNGSVYLDFVSNVKCGGVEREAIQSRCFDESLHLVDCNVILFFYAFHVELQVLEAKPFDFGDVLFQRALAENSV